MSTKTQDLACMEVWGGNQATSSSFEKAGLSIWLYSRPCGGDSKGGDVYYLSSCASGRMTRLLLADVAGHGESVAQLASKLRNLMRRHINSLRPQQLFEAVNRAFGELTDGDRFATSIVSSFFLPSSTLTVSIAGHPAPLVRRARADHWELLEVARSKNRTHDMPFGVLEGSKYSQHEIPLRQGDMVLCFTDGLIEACGNDGAMLGLEGLLQLLNDISVDQPEAILPELLRRVAGNAPTHLHEDDLTILLFRVTDRPIPLLDNLAAPLRWLKDALWPLTDRSAASV